ncbi:MAG: thiamine-phosphate kinase [Polyangia bacterium]
MKVGSFGETALIERLVGSRRPGGDGVVLGVGDDAAAVAPSEGMLALVTCDSQVEGVHFVMERTSPERVGRRAAAVSVSDVAAMGGEPRWAVAALAAPPDAELDELEGVFQGLIEGLEETGAALVGGNTVRSGGGGISLDLTVIGEVRAAELLTRGGAAPGDLLCATGELGGSAAGLLALESPEAGIDEGARRSAIERHLEPRARIAVGRVLATSKSVTACIDISDGLLRDAGHLARAGGVALRIDAERVPLSEAAIGVGRACDRDPLELALSSGEELELLFAVERGAAGELVERIERETGVAAQVIGEVAGGEPGVCVLRDGVPIEPARSGWDHFSANR